MSEKISRSDFLKKSGLAAAGVMMGGMSGSSSLFAAEQQDKKERFARLGKVNIAWVGMANRGREVMREFERTGLANIVANGTYEEIIAKYLGEEVASEAAAYLGAAPAAETEAE